MADTTTTETNFGTQPNEISVTVAMESKKNAILIAGMHRSGTSAVTRVLSLLGCALPKSLVPASKGDNDLGFWESPAVVSLNNEILESAGSKWDDWSCIGPDWFESGIAEQFAERAAETIADQYEKAPLIVIKDPRICRFLPVWTKAAEISGYTPTVVLPIRNPSEVAQSLFKRSQIDTSVGQLMWLRHVLDAEYFSRDLARSFIRYDDLMSDWQSPLERMRNELGVVFPRMSAAANRDIAEFLNPSLWRNKEAEISKTRVADTSDWIESTYLVLKNAAVRKIPNRETKRLDEIRRKLFEISPLFATALSASRSSRLELAKVLKDKSQLDADLSEKREMVTTLELQTQELETRVFGLEDALNEAKQTVARETAKLTQAMQDHESELQAYYEKEREHDAERIKLEAEIAVARAQSSLEHEREMAEHVKVKAELEAARTETFLEKERRRADRIKYEADLDAAQAEILLEKERAGGHLSKLEERETARQQELKRLEEMLKTTQQQLMSAEKSHSEELARREAIQKSVESLEAELRVTTERLSEANAKLDTLSATSAKNEIARFKETAKLTSLLADAQTSLQLTRKALSNEEAVRLEAEELAEDFKKKAQDVSNMLSASQEKLKARHRELRESEKIRFGETARLTTLLREQEGQVKSLRKAILALVRPSTSSKWVNRLHLRAFLNKLRQKEISRQREIILAAGLFDEEWYLSQNKDVSASGVDPLQHYLIYGIFEGRAPSPSFLQIHQLISPQTSLTHASEA